MPGTLFSPEDRAKIMQNKNVLRVGDAFITYSPAFKVEAVRANLVKGKPPHLIFVDAGFDLDLIGHRTPEYCLKRWRKVFGQRGEQGLRDDQRGKNGTGRPLERELTVEEKLRRAEARVKYLEKENELLKKFDAIEREWLADHRISTH
jgi:transposase-like protein